jgi:hypothetical protein
VGTYSNILCHQRKKKQRAFKKKVFEHAQTKVHLVASILDKAKEDTQVVVHLQNMFLYFHMCSFVVYIDLFYLKLYSDIVIFVLLPN